MREKEKTTVPVPSVGADGFRAAVFLYSNIGHLSHACYNRVHHADGVQQFLVHGASGLNTLQLTFHFGKLFPQRLVHPGISLNHHFLDQQSADNVLLFG